MTTPTPDHRGLDPATFDLHELTEEESRIFHAGFAVGHARGFDQGHATGWSAANAEMDAVWSRTATMIRANSATYAELCERRGYPERAARAREVSARIQAEWLAS